MLPKKLTMAMMIKLYQVPTEPTVPGIRPV